MWALRKCNLGHVVEVEWCVASEDLETQRSTPTGGWGRVASAARTPVRPGSVFMKTVQHACLLRRSVRVLVTQCGHTETAHLVSTDD